MGPGPFVKLQSFPRQSHAALAKRAG